MPNPSINALRAISAIILKKLINPLQFMAMIVLVALWVTMLLLVFSFSSWWLLGLIVLVPLTILVTIIALASRLIIQFILPSALSSDQRSAVNAFCDKILAVIEQSQTPHLIAGFLIAKDLLRRRESEFIRSIIGDSRSLLRDFQEIQALFRDEE